MLLRKLEDLFQNITFADVLFPSRRLALDKSQANHLVSKSDEISERLSDASLVEFRAGVARLADEDFHEELAAAGRNWLTAAGTRQAPSDHVRAQRCSV